eukprot:s578_g1.t3
MSNLEVSLLCEAFPGELKLVPFVRWLFEALGPGPARAPEESGVPLREFTRLVAEHKTWLSTAKWNPYSNSACRPSMIIKPLTKSRLVAFAELLEPLAPQVFVSHWWGEEFVCFVRALRLFAGAYRSETSRTVRDDVNDTREVVSEPTDEVAFWVCSFANRQWEVNLGSTLQESPFERALAAPSCTHVVMIMEPFATPLQRIWVLEIDPSTAKASQEEDRRMIMEEVDKAVGLEQFGVHVTSLLAEAFRRRGGNQLVMDAPELPMRLYRLHRLLALLQTLRLGKMFLTFDGRTLLHSIAQRKEPGEVRLALAAASEGDLKSCNSLGQTPLHLAAAYNRHLHVLDLLIAAEMDVNARDLNGLTPWMLSAATGHHEALSQLLARGADLSYEVDLWQSEIVKWADKAIPNGLHLAAFSGSFECCQIFLSHNRKVHSTMLTAASINGHAEVLQTILPHADDINGMCEGGPFPSALHSASFFGQVSCVELLLSHRALPNLTCNGGKTAFFSSMATGNEDVGRLLLRYRADPWIKTAAEDSVLGVASGGGHNGCETNGEDKATALHYAAQWGREQTVRLLVKSRADPKVQDEKQMTPLHKAAEYGYVDVISALLGLRADAGALDTRYCPHSVALSLVESASDLISRNMAAEASSSAASSAPMDAGHLRVARFTRLIRALRGVRVVRLLRHAHFFGSYRTLLLLLIVFYCFGVIIAQLVSDHCRYHLSPEDPSHHYCAVSLGMWDGVLESALEAEG